MSKISPIQAQALGLKPAATKTATTAKAVVKKNPIPKPIVAKPVAKPAVLSNPKPVTKLAAKTTSVTKPKATTVKKEARKDTKKAKPEKIKMERDSFTMPKDEYAQIALLKTRLTAMGQPAKKSELLRAGIKLLVAMSDNTLKTTLAKIPVIKTGRPNKRG